MSDSVIAPNLMTELETYLKKHRSVDLVTAYLFFLEKKFNLSPIVFLKEKKIYKSKEELLSILEKENKIYRETPITIQVGKPPVNAATTRVYICPFCNKVYGNNTSLNPQDAIYEHVAKCPENKERTGGIKTKKFYVSDDPKIIQTYQQEVRAPIQKTVYTSLLTGKLFHNKHSIINDLVENYTLSLHLSDVTKQNRFELQDDFLEFIQTHLEEDKIVLFVDAVSKTGKFDKHVARWTEE